MQIEEKGYDLLNKIRYRWLWDICSAGTININYINPTISDIIDLLRLCNCSEIELLSDYNEKQHRNIDLLVRYYNSYAFYRAKIHNNRTECIIYYNSYFINDPFCDIHKSISLFKKEYEYHLNIHAEFES